ncbi:hypothetical protein ALT721_800060 [Alteromonas alvinellae]
MNKLYAVHTKQIETQDLLDMLKIYPSPAEYGEFYLFAQPHNAPLQPVIDLTSIEDFAELDKEYERLLAEDRTGRWVHLNKEQGEYLTGKYYPIETTEI